MSRSASRSLDQAAIRTSNRVRAIFMFLPLVVAAYWWTASSSINPYTWRGDFYNLLADAFLHGQLSLREQPAPQLLQLKDPYDPRQNESYRLHDAALYEGRYYVYHGPTPALTLFLPWRVLTGKPMPQNVAVVIFAAAAFVFSALLWFEVCRSVDLAVPPILVGLGLWSLAFCQSVLFVLRRPAFYEAAITAGFCFLACALWLTFVAVRRNSLALFVLAGLCFGLAAGARPHMILAAAVSVVFVGVHASRRRLPMYCAAVLALTVALGCAALALYNYARFGNPFEFGVSYLLSGSADTRGVRLSASNLIPGLYFLLIHPPAFTHEFPFVYLTAQPKIPLVVPPKFFAEGVAGCVASLPTTALAFLAPLILRRLAIGTLAVASVALVLFVSVTGWATERYELDFAPLLLVVALVAFTAIWNRLRTPALRLFVAAALVAATAYGTFVHAAISITGPEDTMRRGNPAGFARLHLLFQPQPNAIVDPDFTIDAVFSFRDQPVGAREPILCTGRGSFAYIVFAEFTAPGRIRFASVVPGIGGASGAELAIVPGQPFPVRIRYDRDARQFTITHGSTVVFSHSFFMFPTAADDITVGENRVADWIAPSTFHGSVQVLSKQVRGTGIHNRVK